jgi:hypothetical protein
MSAMLTQRETCECAYWVYARRDDGLRREGKSVRGPKRPRSWSEIQRAGVVSAKQWACYRPLVTRLAERVGPRLKRALLLL